MIRTTDDVHKSTSEDKTDDSTRQNTDNDHRPVALRGTRTAPLYSTTTANLPEMTSLPPFLERCWDRPTTTLQGTPTTSATANSARVGDFTGSTEQHATGSVTNSTDVIRAEARLVVFSSQAQRWMTDSSIFQGTTKPEKRRVINMSTRIRNQT